MSLINPDTFDYLDKIKKEDLLHDELLDEQENESGIFDDIDDREERKDVPEDIDDSDAYANDLFSSLPDDEFKDEDSPDNEEDGEKDVLVFTEDEEGNITIPTGTFYDDLNVFCNFDAVLSSLSAEDKTRLGIKTQEAVQQSFLTGKDKIINLTEIKITVFAVSSVSDPAVQNKRLKYGAAMMKINGDKSWNVVFVVMKDVSSVRTAFMQTITDESFSATEWEEINSMAEKLRGSR